MAGRHHAAHPKPRRLSHRGVVFGLIALVVFGVVYGLVVRAYQVEGNLSSTVQDNTGDTGFLAVVEPLDFDARTGTLTMRFQFDVTDQSLIDDGDRLVQGIRVTVYGVDGTHEVRFAAGEPIGNAEIEMGVNGEVYAYPLDTYDGFLSMTAETFQRGAGGINETTGKLGVDFSIQGAVSGWDIKANVNDENGFPFVLLDLKRSFTTKAFAVVLVAMAMTVAILAFIAAVFVVTNRRRFEVALLTWNGAILFALPLLRNYLPGSPPIGAALDIYLYLWIFVFAVISLVLMLIAWAEQRKADLLEERSSLEAH